MLVHLSGWLVLFIDFFLINKKKNLKVCYDQYRSYEHSLEDNFVGTSLNSNQFHRLLVY